MIEIVQFCASGTHEVEEIKISGIMKNYREGRLLIIFHPTWNYEDVEVSFRQAYGYVI